MRWDRMWMLGVFFLLVQGGAMSCGKGRIASPWPAESVAPPSSAPRAGPSQNPSPNPAPAARGPPREGASGDPGVKQTKLAIYWGQNGGQTEPPLSKVCMEPQYDMILLAFVSGFSQARSRNSDGYPEMNFANHCEAPYDSRNPFLLKCEEIAAVIPVCQSHGKQVLLSFGGAQGFYGFDSDEEARSFAQMVWDLFLGGSGSVRPFGSAILDGIDLDIEAGGPQGYAAFATQLRALMNADTSKHYLITAAPQCPFPDRYLGPGAGTALGDAASVFDSLFVQFYNNDCNANNRLSFADSFRQWSSQWQAKGPKVFIGLPAHIQVAGESNFVTQEGLRPLVESVKNNQAFAGIMLWDVSFDQHGQGGYSRAAKEVLKGP